MCARSKKSEPEAQRDGESDVDKLAGGPEGGPSGGPRDGEAATEASAEAADGVADVVAVLESVQRERDELEQRLLRTAADYQNYVRRSEQNVRQAAEQQVMDLGRALVTVLDHFDHATHVDPQATSAETLLEGVNMVREELMRTLSRFGVQRVDVARGDEFDPQRHEALMRQEDADVKPGHVVCQLQPGYVLNEKTLRPAKVALAPEA